MMVMEKNIQENGFSRILSKIFNDATVFVYTNSAQEVNSVMVRDAQRDIGEIATLNFIQINSPQGKYLRREIQIGVNCEKYGNDQLITITGVENTHDFLSKNKCCIDDLSNLVGIKVISYFSDEKLIGIGLK